ncbi:MULTISPECIES: thioesterase II family protein [Streptomyces]|uniref:Thioesterase n=1 Tax=Streptomyces lasiicapitis TaxID=1923961 RepID=A0ABQ2MN63_9ACTN|nr:MULTISPECIES: thioesterase [Streptomyces]QIB47711.1 thioesterase [Streptomyces aureoverticillatus]GGO54759.1 thioesterase [Streptomyces lasiicapitis]
MSRVARPQARPWAARRLVCLSFAGGGTVSFRPWARLLPIDVELRTLCYPGREFRFGDEITGGWEGFVADCADAVATEVRSPYVLYGHSMGALLAYETARLLQERGAEGPESLVLSGHIAPQHWTGVRTAKLATASDEELAASLEAGGGVPRSVLDDPDLLLMAVDLLRMDMAAYAEYEFRPGPRLRAGIHLMVGEQELTPAHEGWAELTDGPYSQELLPGGHFFTPRVWGALPRHMPTFAADGAAGLAS